MTAELVCTDCSGRLEPDLRRCPFCGRVLATRACDACGARVLVLAGECPACGAVLSRKDATDLADTTCPVCDRALTVRQAHGIRLHECDGCGGVFLDHQSFDRATEEGEVRASLHFRESTSPYRGTLPPDVPSAAEPGPEAPFYRRCAACRTVMSRVNFARRSGVMLDVCPHHGTWFDRDELLRALSFVERGGLAETRRREREEREEERRRAERVSEVARAVSVSGPVMTGELHAEGFSRLLEVLARLFGWRVR